MMKKTFWIVMGMTAIACSTWLGFTTFGQTNSSKPKLYVSISLPYCIATNSPSLPLSTERIIEAMQDSQQTTNVINTLVANGTFCQVRGHKWEGGCGVVGCGVIHSDPMRYCLVCGTTQSQQISPWR